MGRRGRRLSDKGIVERGCRCGGLKRKEQRSGRRIRTTYRGQPGQLLLSAVMVFGRRHPARAVREMAMRDILKRKILHRGSRILYTAGQPLLYGSRCQRSTVLHCPTCPRDVCSYPGAPGAKVQRAAHRPGASVPDHGSPWAPPQRVASLTSVITEERVCEKRCKERTQPAAARRRDYLRYMSTEAMAVSRPNEAIIKLLLRSFSSGYRPCVTRDVRSGMWKDQLAQAPSNSRRDRRGGRDEAGDLWAGECTVSGREAPHWRTQNSNGPYSSRRSIRLDLGPGAAPGMLGRRKETRHTPL